MTTPHALFVGEAMTRIGNVGADVVEMLSRAALLAVLLLAISVDSAKLKVRS